MAQAGRSPREQRSALGGATPTDLEAGLAHAALSQERPRDLSDFNDGAKNVAPDTARV